MRSARSTIVTALSVTAALSISAAGHAQDPKPTPPPKPTKPAAHPTARPTAHATPHAGRSQTPPHYAQYVRGWHAPAPDRVAPKDDKGRTMLSLVALNTGDRLAIPAISDSGGFTAFDLDRATHVLREPSSGNEHPIEPRLLDVIYRIQTHFAAQEIRVISGYRTPHGGGSNHGKGRAMDIVVPGASDEEVAKFARDAGFVGVGIYPTSGFVHVDVRSRSYFWVDASGPGRKNRERGIMGDVAARSDASAATRGERAARSDAIGSDVDAALKACAPPSATPEDDDDDSDAN